MREGEELFTGSRGAETMVLGQSSQLGRLDSTPPKRRIGGVALTQSPNESRVDSRGRLRGKEVAGLDLQEQMPFFNLPVEPTIDLTGDDDAEERLNRSPAIFFNLPSLADPPRSSFQQREERKQPFSIVISPPSNEKREMRRKRGRQER